MAGTVRIWMKPANYDEGSFIDKYTDSKRISSCTLHQPLVLLEWEQHPTNEEWSGSNMSKRLLNIIKRLQLSLKKKTNSATFSSSFIVLWKKDFSDRINILQCLLFSVKDRPVNEFRFDKCLKEDVMWSYQRVKLYYFLLDSLEALCDQQLNEREESSNLHGGCIGDLKQEKTLLCSDYI